MKTIAIAILFGALCPGYAFADDLNQSAVEADAADSADTQQLTDTVKTTDNQELIELTAKLATLQDAFDAAFPYAEFCIMTSDLPTGEGGFETVDMVELQKSADLLKRLSPYSEWIKSRYRTLLNAIDIVKRYNDLIEFDNKPYSEQLVNDTANGLLEIYDNGKEIVNAAKERQIDSLYVKADTYRNAVESFAGLIDEIDNQVGQFRDNDAADNLCREEIDNVKANSAEAVSKINSYRYLAELYRKYIAELDKSPRSMTGDIRREIAVMLSEWNDTGNDGGNENK